MKSKILIKVILLATLCIGLSSCGIWYNFKAYFNSYYNAKVLFDQTESSIAKQPRDLFSFIENNIQAQDYLALNKVIEKCSKILQFDTHSGYFIDALWLSGKSFYYQRDYVKAERKFKELQNAVQDPDELLLVNLWLGKTELQIRNFDEGIKILDQVAEEAIKTGEDKIFSEAVIKQIAFLIYKERFAEAIDKCNKFIKNSGNNEVNAEVAYELGKFYYKKNDYVNASAAFKSVAGFSPTFETGYKSKLEYAKCLMDMGKLDDGLAILNELKNKAQYSQYLDEISVELATGYYYKKDYPAALDLFTKIDTVYYGNKSSGVAEYMKAQIYEYHLPNFDSAAAYYDMANQNQELNDDMKAQIRKKITSMTRYLSMRDDIRNIIKGIEYKTDKKNYLRDSVLYVEAVYKDTTEQRKKLLALQNNAQFPSTNIQPGNPTQTGQQDFSINQNAVGNQQAITNPQSAMGAQSGTNQNYTGQQTQQNKLGLSGSDQTNPYGNKKGVRAPRKKATFVKPIMPSLSKDSLNSSLSVKLYNYANLFFADLDIPDSAAFYYKKILSDYPKKSIVPGTYYALGTYYLTSDRKEKADSLFRIVYNEYKKSDAAILAAKKLGLIEETPKTDPADSSYLAAEKKYFNKQYNEAIGDFRNIIEKFPKSKLAPKSAYYIAFIFENDLKNIDSTTAAYEYLDKTFPSSDAGTKAQKRNAVYQEEKIKKLKAAPAENKTGQPAVSQTLKTAIKDSLTTMPDSIKIMMQKAQIKDALMAKQKRAADSIKAARDKLK